MRGFAGLLGAGLLRAGVLAAGLLAAGLLAARSASAQSRSVGPVESADPCDFASGATSFSFEQVRSCYASVPFEPAVLDNILDVVTQHRSFSDLAEAYDARVHWREALVALRHDYPNDAAMHDAIKREHHTFRNVHVSYFPPQCYTGLVVSYQPIELGSTLVEAGAGADPGGGASREQIIFVEATTLADVYREATGIDVAGLVGQRVVSVNGVPALDYFRAYAIDLSIHVDAGGGLNAVLASDAYTLRLNGGGDYFPSSAADEYVFESIGGVRTSLRVPWLFVPRSTFSPATALPLTASTAEFVRLCQVGPEEAPTAAAAADDAGAGDAVAATDAGVGADASPGPSALRRSGVNQHPFGIDSEREEIVRHLRESATSAIGRSASGASGASAASAASAAARVIAPSAGEGPVSLPTSYFEVPPERLGQGIEVIVPRTTNAAVLQYDGHVTALQLFDTNAWVDVARQGIEYACENSDRLIIDLRGNTGGNDTTIRWLHHYLLPESGQLAAAGLLPFRMRNDNPVFSELWLDAARFMLEKAPELGLDPCTLDFTPGCLTDVATGEPLVAGADWLSSPSHIELRGGERVSLSRRVAIWNVGDPVFDSASCAGLFEGDDLVFITDGRNASGGYFLPAAFQGEGVIVTTGGVLGEPMSMGRALSGASLPVSGWATFPADIEAGSEGEIQFEHELLAFTRPVDARMEMLGVYRKDGRTLHLDDPIGYDVRADVWTDLPGSEGFVYERVLEAVDGR